MLDHFYANPERRYWAGHSRLVFELAGAGDRNANAIVDDTADALVSLVHSVACRLGLLGPVVLGGGLLAHQQMPQEHVRNRLVDLDFTDVRHLEQDPVDGALELARRLTANQVAGN